MDQFKTVCATIFTVFLLVGCTADKSESTSSVLEAEDGTSCRVDSGSVCGGDGKTYPNECDARASGLDSYESGTCEEMH
ncbi:hypothetical protein GW915_01645 [bacterium]|nr:hypothetical protein [bacterium]